jgi:hypothetical protein
VKSEADDFFSSLSQAPPVMRQTSQRPPALKPQTPAYDFTLEDISFDQGNTKPPQAKPPVNVALKQPPKTVPVKLPQAKQAPTFDYSSLMDFEDT